MLPSHIQATTTNYVLYLNLFTKNLVKDVQVDPVYASAFCLNKDNPITFLSIMHEWFLLKGLSFYEVTINPNFVEEANIHPQVAFIPPIRTIDL